MLKRLAIPLVIASLSACVASPDTAHKASPLHANTTSEQSINEKSFTQLNKRLTLIEQNIVEQIESKCQIKNSSDENAQLSNLLTAQANVKHAPVKKHNLNQPKSLRKLSWSNATKSSH